MLNSIGFHRITKIEVSPSASSPMKMPHGIIDVQHITLTNEKGEWFTISLFSVPDSTINVVVNQPANA